MAILEGFHDKDFMAQIAELGEVEKSNDPAAVAPLCAILENPVGDTAVDSMVRNTLHNVLLHNPAELLALLESGNKNLQRYCTSLAAEAELAEAAPVLRRLAEAWGSEPGEGEALHEALSALARLHDGDSLPLFHKHLHHEDDYISTLCIEQLGELGDASAIPEFEAIINANEAPERYTQCEVLTWKAIEALGQLGAKGADAALGYLVTKLHHENPTARRIVHRVLVEVGQPAVPLVANTLRTSRDMDTRIMAANVLGFIGHKDAGSALVSALDDKVLVDHNELFAAYEALGKTPGIKSMVALQDALFSEKDPLLILCIVQGLDSLLSPAGAKAFGQKIVSLVEKGEDQGQRILDAVIAAKAGNLFAALHGEGAVGEKLLKAANAAATDTREHFAQILEAAGAAEDAGQLRQKQEGASDSGPRLLAVDDSDAMRGFYAQLAGEVRCTIHTAEHGQAALDLVEAGERYDMFVVDMNMPVMDGIELTRRLRAMEEYGQTPIMMATTESAKSQAQLAKQAGVTGFIIKPFTKELFANKIVKMIH